MSDVVSKRILVLQHKRRQRNAGLTLSSISDELGEMRHPALDAEVSLQLQKELHQRLASMRGSRLRAATYARAEDAVDAVAQKSCDRLSDPIGEFYAPSGQSGFFEGPFSRAFLLSCLRNGYDGLAVAQRDLSTGTLLDHALEDPVKGEFYEVEWW